MTLADTRGILEMCAPLGPISFISMQFMVKMSKIGLAALKGWKPTVGNPGSATEYGPL